MFLRAHGHKTTPIAVRSSRVTPQPTFFFDLPEAIPIILQQSDRFLPGSMADLHYHKIYFRFLKGLFRSAQDGQLVTLHIYLGDPYVIKPFLLQDSVNGGTRNDMNSVLAGRRLWLPNVSENALAKRRDAKLDRAAPVAGRHLQAGDMMKVIDLNIPA